MFLFEYFLYEKFSNLLLKCGKKTVAYNWVLLLSYAQKPIFLKNKGFRFFLVYLIKYFFIAFRPFYIVRMRRVRREWLEVPYAVFFMKGLLYFFKSFLKKAQKRGGASFLIKLHTEFAVLKSSRVFRQELKKFQTLRSNKKFYRVPKRLVFPQKDLVPQRVVVSLLRWQVSKKVRNKFQKRLFFVPKKQFIKRK